MRKKMFLIFIVLILNSCTSNNDSDLKKEISLLNSTTKFKFKDNFVWVGEKSDCFELECNKVVILQIVSKKELEFIKQLEGCNADKSKNGFWEKNGTNWLYKPSPIKVSKSQYLTIEYSTLSKILIINHIEI